MIRTRITVGNWIAENFEPGAWDVSRVITYDEAYGLSLLRATTVSEFLIRSRGPEGPTLRVYGEGGTRNAAKEFLIDALTQTGGELTNDIITALLVSLSLTN